MTAVVAYWVAIAREHHRWAADTRAQLQDCRRHGLADRRKQLRKELQRQRDRRALAMVKARLTRDEVARVDALRLAELAHLTAGLVPGLTMGGRPVLAISSETSP
ncbi:hypothetical protein QYG06_17915 [Xanthomonas euvesicatoria]|uniref:16S rRNA A1518/A1519 N6-dimethyltransferase RsmA/KsgA/DIM1 with predicted DNA glycosylase/AP lyase activity n=3 Tax=Xanthomonas TaxID=338 RepID=A0AB73H3X5_9XANT|nr:MULTISPECIES: hypothetical protein [Xanthomonas]AOY69479.1 hypothetical protein BHE83_23170 [Xanthomonas euvesicatoria pv. vesicatoria str. 85-10]APO88729.1 hypothetical protein BJD11_00715 [Xanthomonas euvesicatoria]KHL62520.1 hypothetical protein XEU66b_06460 [Xanthomonas euvesicatoria]KLB38597.1 hypothetical protein XEUV206_19620 [Xanthomonas euvesicatoria]KLB43757.1 hypothetical protein XEUV259_20460 [Xanthomonas euvesicatoria]